MTAPGTRTLLLKVDGDARGVTRAGNQAERALLGVDKQADRTSGGAKKMDRAFGSAFRSMQSDLDKLEREMWETGDGMDQAFTSAIRSMRADLSRLGSEGRATGATLDSELGQSLLKVKKDFDQLADEARGNGEKIGGGLSEGIADGISGGFDPRSLVDTLASKISGKAAGFAAVGAVLGVQLFDGLETAWEQRRVGNLISAQTGQTRAASERLGRLAGDTFRDNFGESIEDVGTAVTALFQSRIIDTSDSERNIERLTKKVITSSDVIGEEYSRVSRSAGQAVRTGLVDNVTQGMDLLVHATQRGLNEAGDLLDTIDEYGTSFRSLGLEGEQALGLIAQAQRGGIRNTDLAADALKEFGIIVQDTGSNAKRGFQTIGLDGEKMSRMVAAGGDQAAKALDLTLDALRDMPPSVERSSAAVDIFGTKAEDAGDALFEMDLTSASAEFGDFAGSVEEAAQQLADSQTGIDKFNKKIDSAKANIGEFLDNDFINGSALNDLNDQFQELALAQDRFLSTGDTSWLDELKRKYPDAAAAIDDYIDKNRDQIEVTEDAADTNIDYAKTFDQIVDAAQEASGKSISLSESMIRVSEAMVDAKDTTAEFAGEGLNKTKTAFDLNTEAGREMEGSLNDIASTTWGVVDAMQREGKTSQEVTGYIKNQRDALYRTARQMGLSEQAARAYADRLLQVPKTVATQAQFNATQATRALDSVLNRINQIKRNPVLRQDVYLYTHALQGGGGSVRDYSSSYTGGGGRATGGPVFPGRAYKVGERGEEIFVPAGAGNIVPNHQMPGGDTYVTVQIDGQQLQARIDRSMRENQRATKRAAMAGTGGAR